MVRWRKSSSNELHLMVKQLACVQTSCVRIDCVIVVAGSCFLLQYLLVQFFVELVVLCLLYG